MPYLEVKHPYEIASWAAVYKFNYPTQFDALVDAYGKAKGEQIAATLRYIEHYQTPPTWAVYAPKVNP